MANSVSTQQWSLRMPAGSLQEWAFTFTTGAPGGTTPWPITGASWEYVVRTSATATGSPLFEITTTPSATGQLAVTATLTVSQVLMEMYPAATATLTPGTLYHALWQNAGTTAQLCIFDGLLLIDGAPQP